MTPVRARLAALTVAHARVREALAWALSRLDRGDGVLEYTGPLEDGKRAKAALALPVPDGGKVLAVLSAAAAILWDKDDEGGLHYCSVEDAHRLIDALAALRDDPAWTGLVPK